MEVPAVMLLLIVSIFLPLTSMRQKKGHCGRPIGAEYLLKNDRVVAGYDVGYYRYPWYAALIRYDQVVCGGVLIGPKTVLTAAHCYKEYLNLSSGGSLKLEDIYTVKLGLYNICTTEKSVSNHKIEKVQVHEDYKTKMPYYDICILTLASNTDAYQPICLPERVVKQRPKDGTVPGMGTLKYQGNVPCTLHEIRILIYPDKDCHDMIKSTGNDEKAITNAFCAGYLQGGIDSCQGDSGGPLQVLNQNGDYVLLGIVSFGFGCADPGLLGMYTDVSQYLDWIEDKSGLDTSIVNLIYDNKTATTIKPSDSTNSNGPIIHHKRHHYHRRPYRRPIRIIILNNNHPVIREKSVLHVPIETDNKN